MKEVLDFLSKAGVFYLATVDGDRARVRPLGFVMEQDNKLAFCTSNKKDMYKQLTANPNAEISCFNGESTLRICGKATFVTSPQTQQKALDTMPSLGNLYSVGDGNFEIFVFDDAKAVRATMSGECTEITL